MEAHVFFLKCQKPFAAFAKDHGLANIVKVFTQLCVQLASIRMRAIIYVIIVNQMRSS